MHGVYVIGVLLIAILLTLRRRDKNEIKMLKSMNDFNKMELSRMALEINKLKQYVKEKTKKSKEAESGDTIDS